jgi:hypothetical protein
MNRSTLAVLGFALALAAGGCGRYGPPIRAIDSGAPAPEPSAESTPTPSDQPTGENTIETFEDERIP